MLLRHLKTVIVKIYVDGQLDSEGNVNFNDISFVQNADITIGSANGNSNILMGKIDNVSIWNRPLEGSEILSQLFLSLLEMKKV